MSDRHSELVRSIESVVGSENVTRSPALNIDGLNPSVLALPGCAQEVAECLRLCSSLNAAVIPAGSMSWLESGNPVRRVDVVLSLKRMTRVVDYSPPDLTATVEAGLTLGEFNELTKSDRQWLPLDPPGSSGASLGAIAACNSSGALRFGFGTPRDYVIGLKLAHADGTESKCGGRVVKNVAGYDMNKLYVGSYGTLAVITELTFKLRPLPESNVTVVIRPRDQASMFDFAKSILASELQPASVFLTKGLVEDSIGSRGDSDAVLIRLIDNEAAVRHQVGWVNLAAGDEFELSMLSDEQSESVWQSVTGVHRRAENALRISLPVSSLESALARVTALEGCFAAVDLGMGTIRLAFDDDEKKAVDAIKQMRSEVAELSGTLFVERASLVVRRHVDAWGDVGSAESLMKSVKAGFDPESVLNPGRFVAGI